MKKKKTYFYNNVPIELGTAYDVTSVKNGQTKRIWGNCLTEFLADYLVSEGLLEVKEESQELSFSECLKTIDQNNTRLNDVISYLYDVSPVHGLEIALKAFSNAMTKDVDKHYFPNYLWCVDKTDGVVRKFYADAIEDVKNVAWFASAEDAIYACNHMPNLYEKAIGHKPNGEQED